MPKYKYWYILERHNPQIGVYYRKLGNVSKKEATRYTTGCLYGYNFLRRYENEDEYNKAASELKAMG